MGSRKLRRLVFSDVHTVISKINQNPCKILGNVLVY